MKLRALTLYVVISVLLLSTWNNAFAEEQKATLTASEAAAVAAASQASSAEKSEDIYEKLKEIKFWFFVFGCGAISILVKLVEFTMQREKIENEQELKKLIPGWPLWAGWFFSASAVGLLAYLVGLFQASAVTAVTVGLGWPAVFEQLKEKYGTRAENKDIGKKQPEGDKKQSDG